MDKKIPKFLKRLMPVPERPEYVTDPYSIKDMVKEVSEGSQQLSPEDVQKIMQIESTGGKFLKNPKSSASGHFQLIDSTRNQALNDIKSKENGEIPANPLRQEALLMKNLINKNENALLNSQTGPKEPNLENLYLAHHFGTQGALDTLNNPQLKKSQIRSKTVRNLLKKNQLTTIDDGEPSKDLLELLKED